MDSEHKPGRPWTTGLLASEAGVDDSYIRRLLIAGKLDGYKLGREWLIEDEAARAWLASRKRKE